MKDVQELARKGKYAEADALAQKYQEAYPDNPEVYFARGVLHRAVKSWSSAAELFEAAAGLKPDEERYRVMLGTALIDCAALERAEDAMRTALTSFPGSRGLNVNLGVALMYQGRPGEAEELFRAIEAVDPQDFGVRIHLADCRFRVGDDTSAIEMLRAVLAQAPDALAVKVKLAEVLRVAGRAQEGHDLLAAHLKKSQGYESWLAMGRYLEAEKRLAEARECFDRAIAKDERRTEALVGLGRTLGSLGTPEDGAVAMRRALEIDPRSAEAHLGVALLMRSRKDWKQAYEHARRAVELAPNDAGVLATLASIHRFMLRKTAEGFTEAHAALVRAHSLAPRELSVVGDLLAVSRSLCIWQDVPALEKILRDQSSRFAQQPFTVLAMESVDRAYVLRAGRARSESIVRTRDQRGWKTYAHEHRRSTGRPSRLRVGYLSSDLHDHATSYLAAQLFESHDHEAFEWFAYSAGGGAEDAMRARLKGAFDHFIDVRDLDHPALAERIVSDGIDILVDLKGHTDNTRIDVMALRPAPVQVTYLGYPGTCGASYVDYVITDEIVSPESEANDYTEKFAFVRGSYQCNDSTRRIESSLGRAACGLPDRGFVFCCFNQHYKISERVFSTWMEILRAVPDSVLWLYEDHGVAVEQLRAAASRRGIDATRLVFAPRAPHAIHLGRLQHADLALDTLPYNMHTTASDALWAGVPVISTPGDTFASRVGASLLTALGLSELITTDLDAYRDLAIAIAQDPARHAALCDKLAQARTESGVFDGVQFARQLESLFEQMWGRFEQGQAPDHLHA